MDYWLLICDASDGLRRATAIYSQGQPCMTGAFALTIADGIWPSLTHPAVGPPFISGALIFPRRKCARFLQIVGIDRAIVVVVDD
jgi:hypothetical protein